MRSKKKRALRWLAIGAAVLLAGLVGFTFLLYLGLLGPLGVLDAPALEELLQPPIAAATHGLYDIDIGRVEAGLSSRDLIAHDVRIAPRQEAIASLADSGELPALRFALQVGRFEIHNVDRMAALTGKGLIADRIEVDRPTIWATLDPSREGADVGPPLEIDSRRAAEDLAAWVREKLRGAPELRIGTVAIRDGAGSLARTGAADADSLRVGRVDITFDNLHIHGQAGEEGFRSLFSDDVRLEASDFDFNRHGGSGWLLNALSLSTGAGDIRLRDLRYDPGSTVAEYLERTSVDEPARRALWVGEADASGLDFQRLIGHLDLDMDRLTIAGLRLEILDDRHKPSSGDDDRPVMPHDLFRDFAGNLEVDTLELREGHVSYSERHPQAPRPGTIAFEDVSATITNLSNDPQRMSAETPSVWKIDSRVYGQAPLSLTLKVPLLAPPPRMQVHGEMRDFGAALFNPVLVPLAGMELRDGRVLGISFDLDYTTARADGVFRAEYRHLRVSPVDRASGNRDLKDVVVGFVASRLAIHDDNVSEPGRPARVAPMHYRIDPRDPFLKILWEPLRDGARDLVKR